MSNNFSRRMLNRRRSKLPEDTTVVQYVNDAPKQVWRNGKWIDLATYNNIVLIELGKEFK